MHCSYACKRGSSHEVGAISLRYQARSTSKAPNVSARFSSRLRQCRRHQSYRRLAQDSLSFWSTGSSYGESPDGLCLVTDAPISDRRIRFLENQGVGVMYDDGYGLVACGTLAQKLLGIS
jgi:hypothetical protein